MHRRKNDVVCEVRNRRVDDYGEAFARSKCIAAVDHKFTQLQTLCEEIRKGLRRTHSAAKWVQIDPGDRPPSQRSAAPGGKLSLHECENHRAASAGGFAGSH